MENIKTDSPVLTVHEGDNSGLIKAVTELYFEKNDRIADVTFGKGTFWKKVTPDKFRINGTDIKNGIDFRDLPYDNDSFDHSVIDPPYARISNLKGMVDCYNTTRHTTHDEIIELYKKGLEELKRITRKNGYILCKCQDEVHGCKQKWSHIEIHDLAVNLGLYPKDLFILVNKKTPKINNKQQHARKNHSYLWIFQVK